MSDDMIDRRIDFADVAARILERRDAEQRQEWERAFGLVKPVVLAWLVIAFGAGALAGAGFVWIV